MGLSLFSNVVSNTNKELSVIFKKMSECYEYLGPGERFRAIAYDVASKTMANLREPVESYGKDIHKLDELKGVGESIAEKIIEYTETGKIDTYEKLKKKVPVDLFILMDKEGVGSGTIRKIHDVLHINTLGDLKKNIANGKIRNVKGLGTSKINLLTDALQLTSGNQERISLKEASLLASDLLEQIVHFKGIVRCAVAGSIRRKKETIGDIDIIVCTEASNRKNIVELIAHCSGVKKTLLKGDTKLSVMLAYKNFHADFRIVEESEFGAALLYFTGSKEHNVQLRLLAKKRGLKLNEYGVFRIDTGKRIAGRTEEEVYKTIGLRFIIPEERIGKNEIAKAIIG